MTAKVYTVYEVRREIIGGSFAGMLVLRVTEGISVFGVFVFFFPDLSNISPLVICLVSPLPSSTAVFPSKITSLTDKYSLLSGSVCVV